MLAPAWGLPQDRGPWGTRAAQHSRKALVLEGRGLQLPAPESLCSRSAILTETFSFPLLTVALVQDLAVRSNQQMLQTFPCPAFKYRAASKPALPHRCPEQHAVSAGMLWG